MSLENRSEFDVDANRETDLINHAEFSPVMGKLIVDAVRDERGLSEGVKRYEAVKGIDRYNILRFTEKSYPEGAFIAQQIQGESYKTMGYVKETGLDEYGRMLEELDRSRGDNVIYYLAESRIDNEPQAALRQVNIEQGAGLDSLASYRYCKDSLYEGESDLLSMTIAQYGESSLVEIAALSKLNKASSFAPIELIRKAFYEAITTGKPLKWLITFAEPAYDSLIEMFGEKAIRQIGDKVSIDIGDPRTSDDLRLVPVIVETHKCLAQIADGAKDALDRGDADAARKMLFGFDFIKNGIAEQDISKLVNLTEVERWRKELTK